ncbi:hypothetical protein C0995_008150 [Termitomyces sp. Mi166|nr:hypothetical protein C0995_008150 [Termitomyces sp. Mi166\
MLAGESQPSPYPSLVMASSSIQKATVTYADTLRSMNSLDVRADLDSACEQLALTTVRLMENFDYIAKQLHTIDMLGSTPPFKSQWNLLRKDFKDLLWNFRNNAGFVSGRLKTRNSTSSRSHDEKLQVLGSFMSISADHAALTHNLVGSAVKLNHSLNTFHTEFLKASGSQQELQELAHKLTDLESNIRQSCASSKRKSSRSKTSHQRLALITPELVSLGRLYEQLDLIRNEVAHAQYTAQETPGVIVGLLDGNYTLYATVADALDTLVMGIDPSHFTKA